ncbi:Type IV pilus assembly PilZ domain protein [Candidatus Omnitrophus magneticus]|uniref:Type IV pilus assembly PilZ domain protein n=1 Tax=Candidatus Omnitrophus magneticus TaxID=1609969 RepID=A0A0F0CPM2_9BACT|nr:Type IV pilus assembly PilZ domain protein [Candidatus Omnitrophus magneticus]
MTEVKERRKHPRIQDPDIGIQLSAGGFDMLTQSLNISASGIFCSVKERIPLMTRLQIVLSLPEKTKQISATVLNLEGIVVRENPVMNKDKIKHYDLAICFNSLTYREKTKLAEYINSKISK